MRLLRLTLADIRFQWKYGFYLLYVIFTAVYIMILTSVPQNVKQTVATIMIYTDPAAMGLFFMGAIILFERSQRVDIALSVTPIRPYEYMLAKLISLALIGVVVGLLLALVGGVKNMFSCILGIVLSSIMCTSFGLIAAQRSNTLNKFMLLAVPFELLLFIPPILLLFGIESSYFVIFPGVASVWLIYGEAPSLWLCLISLVVWCIPAVVVCLKSVNRYLVNLGGKL